MKNILLINFGGIGDEILFLPVIQSLKKEYPDSKITLCVEPRSKSIKDLCPLIDEIIMADIKSKHKYIETLKLIKVVRSKKFDTVISSGKASLVAILLFLFGIKRRIGFCASKISKILLTDSIVLNENQYAANMYHDLLNTVCKEKTFLPKIQCEALKDEKLILIHPGVSKMSIQKNIIKTWKSENWKKLIEKLLEMNYKVGLCGGPDDKEVIEEIGEIEHPNFENYYGKTKNIYDLAKLIKSANTLICFDSAPMHLGVATNTRTIAIFGPTNEEKLIPKDPNFIVIKNEAKCRPCLWNKRLTTCDSLECLNIKIEDILKHF